LSKYLVGTNSALLAFCIFMDTSPMLTLDFPEFEHCLIVINSLIDPL